jgi:predicted extracellular nuclease
VQIEAVVVGDFQGKAELQGFFVQEEAKDFDQNPKTSEGLFVFDPQFDTDVALGDRVRITGTVKEHQGLTQLANIRSVERCSSGHEVLAQILALPLKHRSDLEALEGMAVSFQQTLTVSDNYNLARYGELSLSSGGRLIQPTDRFPVGEMSLALQRKNQLNTLTMDDARTGQNREPLAFLVEDSGKLRPPRVGDSVLAVKGLISEGFGRYRLLPNKQPQFLANNPRPDNPAPVQQNELRVASFNLYNYFNGNGLGGGFPTARGAKNVLEFSRQRAKTLAAMAAMNADVFALLEMENDGDQSGSAIQDLLLGLKQRGLDYQSVPYDRARLGSDQISVAMIYKPSRVGLLGDAAVLNSEADAEFLDQLNRPSLAQSFKVKGLSGDQDSALQFTLVVNHFKSKGSSCERIGDKDLGDGQGNCNGTRTLAAKALARWITSNPTGSESKNILLVGDFNAYAKEDPVRVLEEAGFAKPETGGVSAYSYVYKGLSGSLDHVLASEPLLSKIRQESVWPINADEAKVLDYKLEHKTSRQRKNLYDTSPFRSSDHDPVWVDIKTD